MKGKNKLLWLFLLVGAFVFFPRAAFAMHIAEGILPLKWALFWFVLAAPFLYLGLFRLRRLTESSSQAIPMVGLVGSAVFIVSCMPIPIPVAGSCSHPVGSGLAAIIIGPSLSVVVSSVALLLQALFLAHGGLSTLGANIFSMGVAGSFVGYGVFRLMVRLGSGWMAAAFLAGLLSDWATYTLTSLELSSALHGGSGAFGPMFVSILLAFAPTQVPLGILEGVLCAMAYGFVRARRFDLLNIFEKEGVA